LSGAEPRRYADRIRFAGLFAATLIWVYSIDALDVFDYAMHGRMFAILGANPYVALPAWFPDDSFLPFVGWKTYPSVYGPLWTYIEGAIGLLSGDNLLESVLLFKFVAAASSIACAWFAYVITQRWTSAPAASPVVLIGWNPLVVLMAGGGDNAEYLITTAVPPLEIHCPGWRTIL